MEQYIGYGFNIDDLTDSNWLELLQKDKDAYAALQRNCLDEFGNGDTDSLRSFARDWLDIRYENAGDYLAAVINNGEKEAAGADDIVGCYDTYLIFESIRFTDDSKRALYIRNEADFIKMIGRYIPTGGLRFGSVWGGGDECWID